MELPRSVAEEIHERADRLEQFYRRIMRCRVTVEGPGRHHRQGTCRVRIELTVPGSRILVNRQSGENAAEAVREAFDAATRRVEDYVRRTRGFVKRHEAPERRHGYGT
jgi:ribosome-associated translation inhibitor RaiA